MENQEQQHKRRVRYQGTHPRYFNDKYKELQPEKYADTVEKIIQKGNTPAGMHISIMVEEILNFLAIKPGEIGLDATLGYGGHTSAMLKCLENKGHIYALDIDPIEINKTRERLEKMGYGPDVLTIKHLNFANIDEVFAEAGKFDFILADLGVSSMQIVKKSSQRVFQSLRIDVNSEFEALYAFLEKLPNVLAKNGRVAVLTFHSGEDRLVKKSFKMLFQEGVYSEIATEVIRPSAEECNRNSRARSTKMRWAIKA